MDYTVTVRDQKDIESLERVEIRRPRPRQKCRTQGCARQAEEHDHWCAPCELAGLVPDDRRRRSDGIAPKELVMLLLKDMPEFGYGQSVSRGIEQLQAYSLAFGQTLRAA